MRDGKKTVTRDNMSHATFSIHRIDNLSRMDFVVGLKYILMTWVCRVECCL